MTPINSFGKYRTDSWMLLARSGGGSFWEEARPDGRSWDRLQLSCVVSTLATVFKGPYSQLQEGFAWIFGIVESLVGQQFIFGRVRIDSFHRVRPGRWMFLWARFGRKNGAHNGEFAQRGGD